MSKSSPTWDITPNSGTRDVTGCLHSGQMTTSRDPHSARLQKMCPHPNAAHPAPIFSKQHAHSSTSAISSNCFRSSPASFTLAFAVNDASVASDARVANRAASSCLLASAKSSFSRLISSTATSSASRLESLGPFETISRCRFAVPDPQPCSVEESDPCAHRFGLIGTISNSVPPI